MRRVVTAGEQRAQLINEPNLAVHIETARAEPAVPRGCATGRPQRHVLEVARNAAANTPLTARLVRAVVAGPCRAGGSGGSPRIIAPAAHGHLGGLVAAIHTRQQAKA
jgi:hypothetical protein